jgi:hypothetical protein
MGAWQELPGHCRRASLIRLLRISLDRIFENPLSFGLVRLPVHKDLRRKSFGSFVLEQNYIEVTHSELSGCLAEEELEPDRSVLKNIAERFFAMRVNGDSMEPRFIDGDIVIVKKQNWIESGKIAAVCSDNKSAALYKVKWQKKGVDLISQNPAYDTEFVTKSDCDAGNLIILGAVVRLQGMYLKIPSLRPPGLHLLLTRRPDCIKKTKGAVANVMQQPLLLCSSGDGRITSRRLPLWPPSRRPQA